MITLTRSLGVNGNGTSWNASSQYAYSGNPRVSDAMLAAETSIVALCAIPYAKLAFIAIFASGALTLQAKASGGADVGSPILIDATRGFMWASNDGTANPFNTDIANFVITKAVTTADVQFAIEPLFDATT